MRRPRPGETVWVRATVKAANEIRVKVWVAGQDGPLLATVDPGDAVPMEEAHADPLPSAVAPPPARAAG